MAKRKSERQIKEGIQHAEYLGLRTNQMWERRETGKRRLSSMFLLHTQGSCVRWRTLKEQDYDEAKVARQ